MADVRRVLGGNDDISDGRRLAILVEHRDLALGVRAQPADLPALAQPREFPAQAVRKHDRCRHELGSFVARVAEHQPLIPGTLLRRLFASCLSGIHSLRDIGTLRGNVVAHENVVRVKDVVPVNVADLANRLPDDRVVVELRLRRDLTSNHNNVALDKSLACHSAEFVLRKAGVQYRIGNGVANLVRVAFTDGF